MNFLSAGFFSAISPPVMPAKIPCFIGASVLFSPGQKRRLLKLLLQPRKSIAQWAWCDFFPHVCSSTTAIGRENPFLPPPFLQPVVPIQASSKSCPPPTPHLIVYWMYTIDMYIPHDWGTENNLFIHLWAIYMKFYVNSWTDIFLWILVLL